MLFWSLNLVAGDVELASSFCFDCFLGLPRRLVEGKFAEHLSDEFLVTYVTGTAKAFAL